MHSLSGCPLTPPEPALVAHRNPPSGLPQSCAVLVHFMLKLTSGFANSVWHGTVFITLVYGLSGSNAFAGYLDAVQNVTALMVSWPVGWLADHWSMPRVVAIGGLLTPMGILLTALA